MRAALFEAPGEIVVDEVPTPTVTTPTSAVVRITHTAVCGSDLWFYRGISERDHRARVGHEPMGIVEAVGDAVRSVTPGDRVFAPFLISCGRCEFCRRGLQIACTDRASWAGENGGAQGEYVHCPHADGTLVRIPEPAADDPGMLRSILPLTDVMGTGHHAAVSAGVGAADRCVVIGDGAVGLCGVLAARRLGARQVVAMGHHPDRLALAEEFGATETIAARGEDAVDAALAVTDGGVDHVLECVGATSAMETATAVCRPGGTIGYVGVPHGMGEGLDLSPFFRGNITLRGGVAPVRAYAEELLADVLAGTLDPAPIFDLTVDLEAIADGYAAMDDREATKVLVTVDG